MVTDQEIIDNQNENTQKILECIEALKTNCNNRIAELEKENTELKEQNSKTKELLTKVIRNTWSIDSNVVNEINKFLKESKE